MGVKTSVFASKAERENFYKISRQWGKNRHLYHNLPFLHLFNLENLFEIARSGKKTRLVLSEVEKARLKKTSVDYTLCDLNDAPLLCVEFDGMNEGFNVGPIYHHPNGQGSTSITSSNPWRKEIIELKLKVALAAGFPFFVVGHRYFRDLSPSLKLTMVDGIVGVVLANQTFRRKLSEGFTPEKAGMSAEDFAMMSYSEQQEVVEDWVLGIETDTDEELNPVSQMSGRLFGEVGCPNHTVQYLAFPRVPDDESRPAVMKFFKEQKLEGAHVVLETDDVGEVSAEAWLPCFRAPYYSGLGLCEDIALLLASEKLKALRLRSN